MPLPDDAVSIRYFLTAFRSAPALMSTGPRFVVSEIPLQAAGDLPKAPLKSCRRYLGQALDSPDVGRDDDFLEGGRGFSSRPRSISAHLHSSVQDRTRLAALAANPTVATLAWLMLKARPVPLQNLFLPSALFQERGPLPLSPYQERCGAHST